MLSYTLAFGICLIVLQGVIAPPPPPPPAAGGAPPPPAPRGGAPPPPPPAARRPPPPVMAPRPAPVRPMPMAPQPTQPFYAVTAPIVTGPPSYSDCSCIFADFCPGNGYPKGECKDDGKEGTYCCY